MPRGIKGSGLKTRVKPEEKVLEIVLKYRVEVQHLNLEEVLDKLREMGSAEVVSVETVPGPL